VNRCTANATSPIGSSLLRNCTCNSGYTGDGIHCTICPSGYYGIGGSSPCQSCPINTTSLAGSTSSSNCSCAIGTFASGNSNGSNGICIPCAIGTYRSLPDNTCVACPLYSSTLANGSTSIGACQCQSGYYSIFTTATRYSPSVLSSCVACAIGTYKSAMNNTSTCSACPLLSSTLTNASTSVNDCQCIGGTFGASPATCSLCAAGRWSSIGSAITANDCTICPSNTTSFAGASSPLQCYCQSTLSFHPLPHPYPSIYPLAYRITHI
jgi:hypothetical protein